MVQVIDSEAEITISGKKNTVSAGEIIIMPANEPHALQAENCSFKMILIMIKSVNFILNFLYLNKNILH